MARRKFQALGVYKRVHINPETRRMTLPEPFYDALRLEDELLIAQVGDVLVMRRPGEVVETETDLLSELVEDGFTGTELSKSLPIGVSNKNNDYVNKSCRMKRMTMLRN